MTLMKHDDGGVWVSGPLVGVIVGGIITLFTVIYQFQNGRLWEDGNDIAQLKMSVTNTAGEVTQLRASMEAQSQTLTTILSSIQGVKDASDALKEQGHEQQTQIQELDRMLRPIRSSEPPH